MLENRLHESKEKTAQTVFVLLVLLSCRKLLSNVNVKLLNRAKQL